MLLQCVRKFKIYQDVGFFNETPCDTQVGCPIKLLEQRCLVSFQKKKNKHHQFTFIHRIYVERGRRLAEVSSHV